MNLKAVKEPVVIRFQICIFDTLNTALVACFKCSALL